MDAAADRKDYVEAGRLQMVVLHLDRNLRRLQDLERRMFWAAAQQDFVRAGRFQEQYRVLLEPADGGATPAVAALAPPAMGEGVTAASMGGVADF